MKIRKIDLANMIVNNELKDGAKFLVDRNYVIVYNRENKEFRSESGNIQSIKFDYFGLTKEVEIIEEDKEIEHYDMFDYFTGYKFGGTDKDLLDHLQRNFVNINQELDYLIKAVNELKKGK